MKGLERMRHLLYEGCTQAAYGLIGGPAGLDYVLHHQVHVSLSKGRAAGCTEQITGYGPSTYNRGSGSGNGDGFWVTNLEGVPEEGHGYGCGHVGGLGPTTWQDACLSGYGCGWGTMWGGNSGSEVGLEHELREAFEGR